jgi:hypothetical protein
MGSLPPTDRWQIDGSQHIDWDEWGEEFVVRVSSRAETHLLSAAAGAVLLALLDGRDALTLAALHAKAFQDPDTGLAQGQDTAGEIESVRTIVCNFERLGIVTRAL